MNPKDTAQFSAVYAEAALAFIETEIPQAMLYLADEDRWDFAPTDEFFNEEDVVFILQNGWDGQLSLENTTDPQADDYNAFALRDEIEEQMEEECVARAMIEKIAERRRLIEEGLDEEPQDLSDDSEPMEE